VFLNNFSNHMAYISKEIMSKNDLDWRLLLPLLKETTSKIIDSTPYDSQTGPARRNDSFVIEEHLKLLDKEQKEIYSNITKNIIKTYSKDENI